MRSSAFRAWRAGIALCALAVAVPAGAATVGSTFDVDVDGWTVTTFNDNGNPNFLSVFATGFSPTFVGAGGNPGGYASIADPDNGWTYFIAPGKFLGDQADKLGGTLGFSLQHAINGGTPVGNPPHAVLLGAGTVLVHDAGGPPAATPAWSTYVVPLEAAAWRLGNVGGATPDAATFAAVLGNLSGLYLAGEFVTPVVEVNGLDSVALTAVPLPGMAGLFALAVGVLGTRGRRRT
ncbi:MAG: laminin B domain-containing protein [Gammaproteobacteria bacterium]